MFRRNSLENIKMLAGPANTWHVLARGFRESVMVGELAQNSQVETGQIHPHQAVQIIGRPGHAHVSHQITILRK